MPVVKLTWNKEGLTKILQGGDDFIFVSSSLKEAVKQIDTLYEVNEGLELTTINHEFYESNI